MEIEKIEQIKIPRRPKKFRFQYVAHWIMSRYKPCKVADVGGGKGLLSYILDQAGFDCTVIDPLWQELPHKYRAYDRKRVKIKDRQAVKRISSEYSSEMIKDFDLVVGIHLHGANIQIIEDCKKYDKDFLLMPCCVIGEPIEKREGVNWRKSLIGYALSLGHDVKTVHFNIMGKSIGLYTDSHLRKIEIEQDLSGILLPKFTKNQLEVETDYTMELERIQGAESNIKNVTH